MTNEPSETANIHETLAPPDQLSSLFHMVNRLIPDGQELVSVPPETKAGEALALMVKHGFSQLPVMQGRFVLGIFSYRAFALEVASLGKASVDAASLPVEEFLEHENPTFARLTDEFRSLIEVLDERDAVLVSGPEHLVAILTPMDVLRYLYRVADAFVLIEEIEHSLRALIREATSDVALLRSCVETALSEKYRASKLPQTLEEMTFDDYVALLRDGRNWEHFKTAFGGTKDRLRAKLEPVRDIRNDVFHFRCELTLENHQLLTNCRGWLFRCVRKVHARRGDSV